MKGFASFGARCVIGMGMAGSLLLTQGCLATRDWVKEQMDPVTGRVTKTEGRLDQINGQVSGINNRVGDIEGKLGQFDGRLGQVDAKADKALSAIANLRLERKVVIDMKDGANFAFNSASLPASAQREIDSFMSDLKGDASGDNAIFVVAGHTDSAGSDAYNYDLGKRRADAVSRYLILQKKVDPMRVNAVSYGESAPAADNSTPQGRAKNRRVEILVYREGITSEPAMAATPASQQPGNTQRPSEQQSQDQTPSNRLSQR